MKKSFGFLLTFALWFLAAAAYPQFSFTLFTNAPPSGLWIDIALAGAIEGASTSVDAALYSLEREAVVEALFNAHSRGLIVRMVAEKDNYDSDRFGPHFQTLEAAGIPIVTDDMGGGGSGLCHFKFFVLDGARVWTGSYNPTNRGTIANSPHRQECPCYPHRQECLCYPHRQECPCYPHRQECLCYPHRQEWLGCRYPVRRERAFRSFSLK